MVNRRLFRYSFLKFICTLGLFWIVFLIYVTMWNSQYSNVVNQKFYDIDVEEMIQERLVEVVERNLINEDVAEEMENKDVEVEKTEDDYEREKNPDEQLVDIKPTSRFLIPKPTLSPEILNLHTRLNLTNPGHLGKPVELPRVLDPDIELMLNKSIETYQINEFISNLIPLDRELPDVRTNYCKAMNYSETLPMASVIMVFHNEALSMILRSVYSVLNRSPEHLLREIVLVDDCSNIGKVVEIKDPFI